MSKSSDKPRKQQRQKPQKTLKERRNEKRAAKKLGTARCSPQARRNDSGASATSWVGVAVGPLEAIDGTPVVDIKPVLS